MEKVSFKTIGMVIGALLVLFLFVNAIPWATKAEVKELKTLEPRLIRIEVDVEHIKGDVKEIKEILKKQRK